MEFDQTMMLSIYTWQVFPIRGNNTSVMYHWYVAEALVPPIDITTYSYMLNRELTTVRGISSR